MRLRLGFVSVAAIAAMTLAQPIVGSARAADNVSIDVGGGHVIRTDGKALKIAFFSLGSSNSFLKAQNEKAFATAKELGVSLDIFQSEFDASKQMDQMQIALASKKVQCVDRRAGSRQRGLPYRDRPGARRQYFGRGH